MRETNLKQVVQDNDFVSLVGIEAVDSNKTLYKTIFKNKINRDFKEVAALRWEAMMMIKECNEEVLKQELKVGKKVNQMPRELQDRIRKKYIYIKFNEMPKSKADKLSDVIDAMFDEEGRIKI
ncbi:Uncharacterised protein [uncultured Clostridium sp.]|nr:Uncharacterised protein [uncultured Clostridium sp.]SCI95893.1 Uncharacterised protein [uncultured Clostridium sp.]